MPPFDADGLRALGAALGQWSAWCAFLGFVLGLVRDVRKGKAAEHNPLSYVKFAGLAASLPPGFMLLYGGLIQPEVIPAVAGLRWPIVAAGALFVYTAMMGLLKP